MVKYREILRLHAQGLSNRSIASSCSSSRNTISDVLKRAHELGISWPLEDDVTDSKLQNLLFPEKHQDEPRRKPDVEYLYKEMSKSGVTLTLLWDEYTKECRDNQEIPYSYRQFCRIYNDHVKVTKATMRIKRKPGEIMEVDWAGKTATIRDSISGEDIPVYIYVACLPCSQYAYVEGFLSMNTESWIHAHVHAYEHFGGVCKMTVPDNLKTGVSKASKTDPIINLTYQEMAEHYQTAIMPARVRYPKDKPSAEGTVGVISTWIIASLRNQQFFSLNEINKAIHEKLEEFNHKPFQKREGSRYTAFMEEEKFALLPLPASPYELASWKKATVQYDYHINVEKMYYSVPYEYIKHVVDIRITNRVIEVFYNHFRVASHRRLHGKKGQFSTIPEHMPKDHQLYHTYDKTYFLDWAKTLGPSTLSTVESIFSSYRVEKQAIKSCVALLKIADKYSVERLESACRRALEYSTRPNLKSIKTILSTGHDKPEFEKIHEPSQTKSSTYGFTRGADYYGGNKK